MESSSNNSIGTGSGFQPGAIIRLWTHHGLQYLPSPQGIYILLRRSKLGLFVDRGISLQRVGTYHIHSMIVSYKWYLTFYVVHNVRLHVFQE